MSEGAAKGESLKAMLDRIDGVADEFEPMHFELHPLTWWRVSEALRLAIEWLEADIARCEAAKRGTVQVHEVHETREAFRRAVEGGRDADR